MTQIDLSRLNESRRNETNPSGGQDEWMSKKWNSICESNIQRSNRRNKPWMSWSDIKIAYTTITQVFPLCVFFNHSFSLFWQCNVLKSKCRQNGSRRNGSKSTHQYPFDLQAVRTIAKITLRVIFMNALQVLKKFIRHCYGNLEWFTVKNSMLVVVIW